jgi:hypothetical protein
MTAPLYNFAGKKFSDLRDFGDDLSLPYSVLTALPTDGTVFPIPRAIFADLAGTATVTDANGNVMTGFPLVKGENKLLVKAISTLATTTKVFGAT